MRLLASLVGLIASICICLADTEIRNFHLPLSDFPITVPPTAIPLSYKQRSQVFSLDANSSEAWFLLEPSRRHRSWTARLSWPGTNPTNVSMHLHPLFAADHDRRIALHVIASPLSPSMPHPLLERVLGWAGSSHDVWATRAELVFEPLVWGFIPKTSVPAIGFAVVFAIGAAAVVPWIIRYLEKTKREADAHEAAAAAQSQSGSTTTGKAKAE